MTVIHRFSRLLLVLVVVQCGGPAIPTTTPTVSSAQPIALPPVPPYIKPPPAPLVASGPIVPPVTLTATDGTGLRMMKLVARGVVDDPLAFTELAFTFENPSERALEGTFAITLPTGAAVSRFAMKRDGAWQEGEVVELEQARRAYEDFLHRRQDPALLEQAAGNQFTARVFPIPARGQKEIILSYSHEITRDAPYALPLLGLPEIGEIDVEIALSDPHAPLTTLKQRGYVPRGDLAINPHIVTEHAGLRSKNLAVARVRPTVTTEPDRLSSALVLVDTSASRALGFERQLKAVSELAKLVAQTGKGAELGVVCFDQTTEPIFRGDPAAFGDAEIAKMRERSALGASDLGKALAWAHENAKGLTRVILVSDGVATAGATTPGELGAAALALKDIGVERIDVIAVGGIRDDAALHRITTAGLARDGVVADASADATTVTRRLREATRSNIDVKVEGATFVWPQRLDGVQAGDEALVYAEVPEGSPMRVSLGGAPATTINVSPTEPPLIERAWAKAKIASLLDAQERSSGEKVDAKKAIVELSISKRVLTPYTALLVLETDADYERFKIDRHALTDVMTVERGRVALVKRERVAQAVVAAKEQSEMRRPPEDTGEHTAQTTAPPPPPVGSPTARDADGRSDERIAVRASPAAPSVMAEATVDMTAQGAVSGGGGGQGIGLGSARMSMRPQQQGPTLRQGTVTVTGHLPSEVIQRIVRQNFGRFRLCYSNGLQSNPALAGRVAVRFVIAHDGSVQSAADGGSDLPNASVVACVVAGFRNLSFPQPEVGTVTVVYPVIFASGDTASTPPVEKPAVADPYEGRFKTIMDGIAKHDTAGALADAVKWHGEAPGDQMALVALGESLEATKDYVRAARAYGSLIDLFPARADVRRFAGVRLEHVSGGLDLARDSFAKAVEQRPDHPSSHRLLAYALVKQGELAKAFDVIVKGAARSYPLDRFPGVDRILHEDIGLIAAAWIKAAPARRTEIMAKVKDAKGIVESAPSIRFVLTWETDANDVDFHIYDAKGGHAFYGHKNLPSGGELYADITTGYGPECFTIRLPRAQRSTSYALQANYFSRGPMGFGMGKLEVIDHDGQGGLTFEEHPYIVMIDHAFVDLGTIKR
jgi:hypothetical protein